jgi:hypothetical protein
VNPTTIIAKRRGAQAAVDYAAKRGTPAEHKQALATLAVIDAAIEACKVGEKPTDSRKRVRV